MYGILVRHVVSLQIYPDRRVFVKHGSTGGTSDPEAFSAGVQSRHAKAWDDCPDVFETIRLS